ncbi:interleukin-13 receptor subunit alpha-1 isoform X2 [Rhinatrema bivittatum]|uniref:interleukin-13 receptor subunit alpha-1 isoform X2 n=1 Tax=Rhinatrema bivittatum TaxID=194408 RepID=UPI00112C13CC|nr:interleukin-13 receptor subunit alpha-1 isoform X2 [Rhinatrema bivittatum]
MGTCVWSNLPFLLFSLNGFQLSSNVISACSSKECLPPPSNLRVIVEDRFILTWTWSPSENILLSQGCILKYNSMVKGNSESKMRDIIHYRSVDKGLDLNHEVCLKVRAECANETGSYGESDWTKACTLLSKGVPDTSVTNVTCFWYNMEYMNCTWQPGKRAPPDISYVLYYRHSQLNSSRLCPESIYKDQRAVGCHFSNPELPRDEKISFMVTDHSERLKPFYKEVDLKTILKPSAPRIMNISKISPQEIYVSWNNSCNLSPSCFLYEVQYKENKLNIVKEFTVKKDLDLRITSKCFPDVQCTIRVRAKAKLCFDKNVWSDWSQEESIGEDVERNTADHMIFLLAIPLILAVAAIVLLIYLKRLKVFIFPPIPDPGKLFKGMFGEQGEDWQESMERVLRNQTTFGAFSGLKINVDKSEVMKIMW